MAIRVGLTLFGAVALDDKGNVVDKIAFSSDPKEAAKSLLDGADILSQFQDKMKGEVTRDGFDLKKAVKALGKENEFPKFSKAVARELIILQMRLRVGRDILIIQSINALDDLNISINALSVRLREWYGLHFPELSSEISEHDKYCVEVSKGERTKGSFGEIAANSMGIALSDGDLNAIKDFAKRIEELFGEKKGLEAYLEQVMKEIAPNVSLLAGANLGARLIAKAGGLKKLAYFPSSTVQLLGAEKALFKHIVSGTPTPKHGLIFQHPSISFVPKKKRGKVARALASKLSLAARLDYFGHGEDPSLKEKFEKRLAAIKGDEK